MLYNSYNNTIEHISFCHSKLIMHIICIKHNCVLAQCVFLVLATAKQTHNTTLHPQCQCDSLAFQLSLIL